MKKIRNSNIEIIRIIAIIFIIFSHYSVHSDIIKSALPIGFNRYILEISVLGNIGVILFILIMGYYSIDSSIKFKKIIKLWFQVLFYSIIIYLIFVLLKLEKFSIMAFLKVCLPITSNSYWFFTCYIILYLLSPFINIFLNRMTKKEFIIYLLSMLFIISIYGFITMHNFYCNELIQFILFYSLGAYLKQYPENFFIKNRFKIIFISTICLLLSPLLFDLLGTKINFFATNSSYFFNRTSIISILFSIALFSIFLKKDIFSNKLINNISACTFGIYLIHDNNYIRTILWTNILKVQKYVTTNYFIFHMIISIIMIFLICLLIEAIRKFIIEKHLFKILDKKIDNIQLKIEKYFLLILNKYN